MATKELKEFTFVKATYPFEAAEEFSSELYIRARRSKNYNAFNLSMVILI